MPDRPLSLHALQVFDAVARHLSFTRAAAELGVTQGAVSYQVRQLERELGSALFERRGRGIALTGTALGLHPPLRRALDEIRHATAQATARRRLTVALTTYFASRWLLPRLAGFMREHPDIELRLVHSAGVAAPLLADVDLGIRWGDGRWPDVTAEHLFDATLFPVCAAHLTRGPARMRGLADLRRHPVLHDDELRRAWSEWLAAAGIADDPGMLEGPVIADANVRMQAAMDGQGFALADRLVAADIAAGRLAAPFDVRLRGYGYYLVGADRLPHPPTLVFRDWLLAAVRVDPD